MRTLLDVVHIEARADYTLLLTFENGEQRVFDMTPYLTKKPFAQLNGSPIFGQAFVAQGTVAWLQGAPSTEGDAARPQGAAVEEAPCNRPAAIAASRYVPLPSAGSPSQPGGLDIAPETLYEKSVPAVRTEERKCAMCEGKKLVAVKAEYAELTEADKQKLRALFEQHGITPAPENPQGE